MTTSHWIDVSHFKFTTMYHLTKDVDCEPSRDFGYLNTLDEAKQAANIVAEEIVNFDETYSERGFWNQVNNNGRLTKEGYVIERVTSISLEEFKNIYS